MRRVLFLFTLLVLGVVGCGGSNLPETAPVSGTVTFMDKPLPGGTVTFHPEGPGNPAFGEIGSDGTFKLTTYKAHDGAVLGKHVVTVEVFAGQNQPLLPGSEDKQASVPKRYTDPKTSPLRFEVQKGPNTASFPLKK